MITERTTTEVNKDTVRRLFAAFAQCDLAAMDAVLAPDFRAHSVSPGCSDDVEGLKQSAVLSHAGLQDCHNEIEDLFAEGDRVAVRYTTRAVHAGTLFGVPPSGRRITMTGIEVYRVVDGRVVEMWGEADMSELFAAAETDTAAPAPA